MIDVFLRWYPRTPVREHLASAVRWHLETLDVRVIVLARSIVPEPYHINSKKMAEEKADTFIYCVIDDDQLPVPDDFFEVGALTLANHPEYGMLAGFPLEYGLYGQPYAERKEEVIEAHSIGCPYFVRKGTLTFPEGPLRQYDAILSKVVTDQGLKTGFARKCLYNHLGFGHSQIGYTD